MILAVFENSTEPKYMPQILSAREFFSIACLVYSCSLGSCEANSLTTITLLQCSRCFYEASFPAQHKAEPSEQQKRPKHSLRFSLTRRVSQTTIARNKVMLLSQSIRTQTVANKQKDRKASSELSIPKAKAMLVVADVVVIAGPAWERASWIRAYALCARLV